MRRALVAAAAVVLLAAAVLPCPPAVGREAGPPAGAPSLALHASHGAPDADAGAARELRAPCPCGCRHAAGASSAGTRLEPALLRAGPAVARPIAAWPVAAALPTLAEVAPATPDPVPRAA